MLDPAGEFPLVHQERTTRLLKLKVGEALADVLIWKTVALFQDHLLVVHNKPARPSRRSIARSRAPLIWRGTITPPNR